PDVAIVVDRHSADVHPDLAGLERNEDFLAARERVVDAEHEAEHRPEEPTAAPRRRRDCAPAAPGDFAERLAGEALPRSARPRLRSDGARCRSFDWLECRDAIEYISSVAAFDRRKARAGNAAARLPRGADPRRARLRAGARADQPGAALGQRSRAVAARGRRRARAGARAAGRESPRRSARPPRPRARADAVGRTVAL